MEATEPMSLEQAAEALVQPEEQPVEEVVEEETESESESEPTDELEEEQPETDSDDEGEEVEEESDDEEESDEIDDSEDDEDNVEDDESEDPATETHTVKVDGQEKQVTLEELKRGYSGQQYVQKGMQQAAEARKQAEDVYAALAQERSKLASIIDQVQKGAVSQPQPPSRELFDNDPIGYMEADLNYKEQMKVYENNVAIVRQQLEAQTEAEGAAKEAYMIQEAQRLVERNPNLADPKKMDAFLGDVDKAGKLYGYAPEEVSGITDGRAMEVLVDAMKWRNLNSSGKDIVREKSKKARTPIKPKAKKTTAKNAEVRAKRDKLRRSGSLEDAMALILDPNLK